MTLSIRAPAVWLPRMRNGVVDENGWLADKLRIRMVLIDPSCLDVPHGLLLQGPTDAAGVSWASVTATETARSIPTHAMITENRDSSNVSTRVLSNSQLLREPAPP